MIEAFIGRDEQGRLAGFHVSGHAGFARRGEDIVCAAVSALAQAALLGLLRHLRLPLRYEVADGRVACRLPPALSPTTAAAAEAILATMALGLREIAAQYPRYLRVTEGPVGSLPRLAVAGSGGAGATGGSNLVQGRKEEDHVPF